VPRDWLGRTFPKWPILCRVRRKTLTQSVNQLVVLSPWDNPGLIACMDVGIVHACSFCLTGLLCFNNCSWAKSCEIEPLGIIGTCFSRPDSLLSPNWWLWSPEGNSKHLLQLGSPLTGLIMVALCNRADHYIFILFLCSFFLCSSFFIPRLILS